MSNTPKAASLLLAAALLLGTEAQALPSDREQPIKVSADSASFDEKTGFAIYRGNVLVQQGTLEMRADEVTLTVDKDGTVQKSLAKGKPARYQQKPAPDKGLLTAEASQIEYDAKADKMTLSGNAKLKQDSSSFTGSTITYFITKQQIDAKGDSTNRVQLVFPPAAAQKDPNKDKPK